MRKQDTPAYDHELINRKNYKALQKHGTEQELIKTGIMTITNINGRL